MIETLLAESWRCPCAPMPAKSTWREKRSACSAIAIFCLLVRWPERERETKTKPTLESSKRKQTKKWLRKNKKSTSYG